MISMYYSPSCYRPQRNLQQRDLAHARKAKMNVHSTDNQYIIQFALPGVKKEDVKLHAENNQLTLEATRKLSQDGKQIHTEFTAELFKRSIVLPEEAQTDTIKAEMNDGILTLTITKQTIPSKTISIL